MTFYLTSKDRHLSISYGSTNNRASALLIVEDRRSMARSLYDGARSRTRSINWKYNGSIMIIIKYRLFTRDQTDNRYLGFDLDLWPLKVIWGQKLLYHSKGHIWFPIWLLWTPSLYLLPFSRYSTSKFLGFDLDLWPLKFIWGRKILYHSKAHIWLPIWLLWTPSLYLLPFSRYSNSKILGFDLDLWPLKDHLGSKNFIPFESPYMISYLTSMEHHPSISYRSRDNAGQNFEPRTKWRILTF